MSSEHHARIEEIFNAALEMPEHERRGFLDEACGMDASLRAEVERLLAEEGTATLAAAIGRPLESLCVDCSRTAKD
jgi:hypothetical protein